MGTGGECGQGEDGELPRGDARVGSPEGTEGPERAAGDRQVTREM